MSQPIGNDVLDLGGRGLGGADVATSERAALSSRRVNPCQGSRVANEVAWLHAGHYTERMSPVQSPDPLTPAPNTGTRGRVYICAECKNKFASWTNTCPKCGLDKGLYLLPDKFARGRGGFVKAGDWVQEYRETYDPGDWGIIFPRGIPGGTIILLRGLAGAGKTRLALKLATRIGPAAILSLENPTDDVVRMCDGAGVPTDDLLIHDGEWSENNLRIAAQKGVSALVIDSVQKMGTRPSLYFENIKEFARSGTGGRVVICISQSNAQGGTRGGLGIEYDLAEVVARVEATGRAGIARITIDKKNRYGPLGKFEGALIPGAARLKRVK